MMAVDTESTPSYASAEKTRRAIPQCTVTYQRETRENIATENKMATSNEDVNDRTSAAGASNSEQSGANANFECNICLDTAKDAVISFCGHLFW